MLEKIRQIAHHYLFKIFFFCLAVIFAASLGDFSKSGSKDVVAIVGKEKISVNEFANARHMELRKLSQEQHLSPEVIQSVMVTINQNVINQLVSRSLIKQEIKHIGIKVPEKILIEAIHKDPNFQKNNVFDMDLYKQILQANNLSEAVLLSGLAENISSKFLLESLVANSGLKNNLTDYLYNYLAEKRLVTLVQVDGTKLKIKDFSEDDLKNYYQKHPELFQSKEYRNFSYLLINDNSIKHNITISDDDIQKEYDENKEEYALPETRDFYHFLTPNQEIAEQIVEKLKETKEHSKVAENFVEQKVISEKFSNQSAQSFLSSLDPSLFQLKEDEITNVIKSDLGWHIFKVTKIHPKQYKPFTEIRREIKNKLTLKLTETQLYELSKQIEDEIASGADFKDIASRYNLQLQEVQNVTINDSKVNPKILITAFQTPVNEDSNIAAHDDGSRLFIVRVESITPPKLQEYEIVKSQVNDLFIADAKDSSASQVAQNIQLEANKTNNIDKNLVNNILKKLNNNSKVTLELKEISRPLISYNSELSESFVKNVFDLSIHKASAPEKTDNATYSFAFLQNIITSKNRDPQIYAQAKEISDINYKNEIYEQYMEYLKHKYKVEINYALVNKKDGE